MVVLSSNDGCIVALTPEAKAVGLHRGDPIFKVKDIVTYHKVHVFSTNMMLYAAMSKRIVSIMRESVSHVEQYSIDESFCDLHGYDAHFDLVDLMRSLKDKIRLYTDVPVSVGIAPTKTLAKIGSKFAKQYAGYRGVCLIDTLEKRRKALALFPLDDVWGIGRHTLAKLEYFGIHTPLEFAGKSESWVRSHLAKPGIQTWLELNGTPCIDTAEVRQKKTICTSRSFGEMVSDLPSLRASVATFASSCANELRGQASGAKTVTVFIASNRFREDLPQYGNSATISLLVPTSDTLEITVAAIQALQSIWREGIKLKQAAQREHRIALNLMGGYNIDGHHIKADLGVEAYLRNNPARTLYLIADSIAGSQVDHTLRDTTFTNADNKPQFLITFNPRYEKQWNSLSLRAGAKLWFSVNKGKVVSAAPDVEVRYTFRQLFSVYGGIGGDYAVTSISNMLDENRYMNLDSMPTLNDYTPADFHAGFDITPVSGLQIGASVSYKMIQNTHFFVNTEFACTETPNVYPKNDLDYVYGNTFNLVYASANLLQAEAHIDYNLKERYTFHASGCYNGWNVKDENVEAWNKPTWEADASIEALFTKNFAGNVRFYYASERKTPLVNIDGNGYDVKTLAPIYDLNLSLSYTFPKNISIFVQANNLLAISEKLRYQNWYGYDNIGTHVMAGISVSF